MAASAAVTGFGTVFAYMSAADTYTALGEVISVSPPNATTETVDVTHMSSDDSYREYKASLRDGGEFSITTNYTEAGATLLQTLHEAGFETFKVTIPGASTIIFSAIPTGWKVDDLEIDGKVTMTFSGKVTGKPTYLAV